MTDDEEFLRALRRGRIARVKRILRWLPRKATIHRYPIVGRFANSARKHGFLWSFRTAEALPALYAGFLLAFTPIYGLQIPIAFFLALKLRANLPILVGLQMLTNPLTAVPIYYAGYHIGRITLELVGFSFPHLNSSEFKLLFDHIMTLNFGHSFSFLARILTVISVGGWMIGLLLGTVSAMLYRLGAQELIKTYGRLQGLQQKRLDAIARGEFELRKTRIPFPRQKRPRTTE
jgi:uncharacterized protein (DUF2062 family)|tara:strand:- start:3035 stop:3733 length:699 start_codon:yes stop_codon:yes gene_type:complete